MLLLATGLALRPRQPNIAFDRAQETVTLTSYVPWMRDAPSYRTVQGRIRGMFVRTHTEDAARVWFCGRTEED